jgi:hypothetical protein
MEENIVISKMEVTSMVPVVPKNAEVVNIVCVVIKRKVGINILKWAAKRQGPRERVGKVTMMVPDMPSVI